MGERRSSYFPSKPLQTKSSRSSRRLRTNWRGTLVTTLQSFQQMDDLDALSRDNIVSLVDECHRSQTGTSRGSRESHALQECTPVFRRLDGLLRMVG